MAEIIKLFAQNESGFHTLDSASRLLPLIRRLTEEAQAETDKLAHKLGYFQKNSPQYLSIAKQYDEIVARWVEKIQRLGALAKGLWLVDFDTGSGYLCWVYPEEKIEYFHSYQSGFRGRKKLTETVLH